MIAAIVFIICATIFSFFTFWGTLIVTGDFIMALWAPVVGAGLLGLIGAIAAFRDSSWYWHWKHRHDRYDAPVPPPPLEAKEPGQASAEYSTWGQTNKVRTADQVHQPGEFVPGSLDVLGAADYASCATCPEEFAHYAEMSLEIIRQEKRASTSLLQRRLNISFGLANALIRELERQGVLGPGKGAEPREILVDLNSSV